MDCRHLTVKPEKSIFCGSKSSSVETVGAAAWPASSACAVTLQLGSLQGFLLKHPGHHMV